MDEIIFRGTQKLENLQIQLGLSLQQSKVLFQQYSERGVNLAVETWHSPRVMQLQDAARELLERILEIIDQSKDALLRTIDPKRVIDRMYKLLRNELSRSHLICGCVGFVIGGLLGYIIANLMYKPLDRISYVKGVVCTNYGDADCVTLLDEIPSPKIEENDEVLVQVKASALSLTDVEICSGYGKQIRKILSKYCSCYRSHFPIILGRSCSGIVLEIGQKVSRFDIGDEVFLTAPYWSQGTACETIVSKEFRVASKPKRIGFEGSAGIAYAGSIALTAIQSCGLNDETVSGKRVLVCGACTPVGCVIIQYCHLLEAEITATSTIRAAPAAKALGVDDIILIQDQMKTKVDLEINESKQFKKELDLREPYDYIFVTTNVDLTYNELRSYSKTNGKLISTLPEYLPSDHFGFLIGSVFWTYIRTKYFFQRIFGWKHKNFGEPSLNYSQLDILSELVDNNQLQSVVDKVFHIYDIGTALDHIQSNDSIGSSIITFRDPNNL